MFVVKYDGTKYNGWQRLTENTEKSIQGKIELVLSKLLNEEIKIIGSGRTDAGVHALMQVCNFKTESSLPKDFINNFNKYLPEDIKIVEIKSVDDRFHSRFNAKKKTYMYRIDNNLFADPFLRKFAFHVEEKLDMKAIKEVSKIFLGEHDFTSFSRMSGKKKSCVRTIESIEFKEENGFIEIYFTGDGFLYNMVRMITGTLIQIGRNQSNLSEVRELLESKDRSKHRYTVPPNGLFLYNVEY